jgi:hypothetical protein
MNAIKIIKQLEGSILNIELPQSFNNKKIEIIILQTDEIKNIESKKIPLNEFKEYKNYRNKLPEITLNEDIDKITNSMNNDIF